MNAHNPANTEVNDLNDPQGINRHQIFNSMLTAPHEKNRDFDEALKAATPDLRGYLQALMDENTSLREFAASAVHDIKAPLRGINLALELMAEHNFDHNVVRETHEIAQKSAIRLLDLSNGLLELAAIPESESRFARVDLNKVIADACSMLGTQIENAGAVVIRNVPYTIDASGRLLLRLFLNLIGNALKYRDPAQKLQVTIDIVKDTPQYLEIAITDTGIGIAPGDVDKIFKPLKRLHSRDEIEGSGLGLAICAKIAKVHGGRLWLDQKYRDGARFILRLPYAADATAVVAA